MDQDVSGAVAVPAVPAAAEAQVPLNLRCGSDLGPVQGMVLVRKTEIDKELVVAVTNVSVTFKKCVKATTYKRECQVGGAPIRDQYID